MELNDNIPCRSEKEQLWASLFNAAIWKASIPDAEKYELIGENLYEMDVITDIGPIKGLQTVQIQFSDLQPPQTCSFEVLHGLVKTAKGSFELKDSGLLELEEMELFLGLPEGTRTLLFYTLEADTGNPLFNAMLETFKGKIKDGFGEILTRVELNTREQFN
ncbi:MAG: hypothetical protein HXX20_10140 [Chloroflexi bacterium]|nr:hypothetical protein [Chloroflexota bacterium]